MGNPATPANAAPLSKTASAKTLSSPTNNATRPGVAGNRRCERAAPIARWGNVPIGEPGFSKTIR
eukprot:9712212-Lingulodinium_polyedra.AAC.1